MGVTTLLYWIPDVFWLRPSAPFVDNKRQLKSRLCCHFDSSFALRYWPDIPSCNRGVATYQTSPAVLPIVNSLEKNSFEKKYGVNLLCAGFETCLPPAPKARGPIAKHISNPDLAPFLVYNCVYNCERLTGWRSVPGSLNSGLSTASADHHRAHDPSQVNVNHVCRPS